MSKKKEVTKDEAVVNENTSEQTAEAVTEEIDETAKKIAELEEELNSQKDQIFFAFVPSMTTTASVQQTKSFLFMMTQQQRRLQSFCL